MIDLTKILKPYRETGSLNELVNLYGFIDTQTFLTKSGDVGSVLRVHGVDYECLDSSALDNTTKRLESALRLFDEDFRVYQYLFKRNRPFIPFQKYSNPIVNTAIENRMEYFRAKAESMLFARDLLRRSV